MKAIIIITFNVSKFLQKQITLYQKFVCKEIKVVDNSSDITKAKEIKAICEQNKVEFIKTIFHEADSSRSHGLALNAAFKYFSDYERIVLSDHDIFPFKPFGMDYDLAGVPQVRAHYNYLWAGFVMINPSKYPYTNFMPFETDLGVRLDTGGHLWNVFDQAKQFSETYEDYEHGNYSIIEDSFMHFRNLSNWSNDTDYVLKVNKMSEILEKKIA